MMYGSPFIYTPVSPAHVAYPMQQNVVAQTMHYSHSSNTLGLGSSNYEEVNRQSYHLYWFFIDSNVYDVCLSMFDMNLHN